MVPRTTAAPIATAAIQIDASMNCQLACPSCPTASGEVKKTMGAGHLDPAKFAALLDANPSIAEVELSNYGEMFLNPKLAEIMRIAWERKVVLHANNGVNLNFAREDALEGLVKYRFRSLSCSIDGATQEAYGQYRVKGDLNRVLDHVRAINRLKRAYRTGFPLLRWQFVVFGHNEHEIAAARAMAQDLGMIFSPKLSWDNDFSPIRNRELVQIAVGSKAASREEYYKATGHDYMRGICSQLWRSPVLNWDGRVNGCCRNFWGHFGGNAFEDGLDEVLHSDAMTHARAMLMGRAPELEGLPCTTCDLYRTMKRDGRWLTEAEVAPHEPGVVCSFVLDAGDSVAANGEAAHRGVATHVDVFVTRGSEVNRVLLARPPRAQRIDLSKEYSTQVEMPPGDYVFYALPRRLDPEFRAAPQALPPVAKQVRVEARPLAQEFVVELREH